MGKDELMKKSIFEVLDKIKFKGGPKDLSQKIDETLYGKRPGKQRPTVRGTLKGKKIGFSEKNRLDARQ
jgi:hypothetical protein